MISPVADYYKKLVEADQGSVEKDLLSRLNNFNFEGNFPKKRVERISVKKFNDIINQATNYRTQLRTELENLKNNNNNNKTSLQDNINSLQEKVDSLDKIINSIPTALELTSSKNYYKNDKDNNDYISRINQLEALVNFLNNKKNQDIRVKAGTSFEKALAATNYVGRVTYDFMKDMENTFKKEKSSWTGPINVKRGIDDNTQVSYTVTVGKLEDLGFSENKEVIKKDPKTDPKSYGFETTSDNGGVTITYEYDPGAKKQGKMDVQLHYGKSDAQNYRVSAKRWTNGEGDLGETSIDAGLNRSIGKSLSELYKLSLIRSEDKYRKNFLDEIHEVAKLAIKSDIAMGLNQKEGYANLLIIDTGSKIKVKNLVDIVENANLAGYINGDLENEAKTCFDRIKRLQTQRSLAYLMLMTSTLNKMKVTINISADKEYSPVKN